MGQPTFLERIREWFAGMAFDLYLWLSGLTADEFHEIWKLQIEDEVKSNVPELLNVLQGIFDNPWGCSLCDSGVMRNKEKGHQPDCPFEIARLAAEKISGKPVHTWQRK